MQSHLRQNSLLVGFSKALQDNVIEGSPLGDDVAGEGRLSRGEADEVLAEQIHVGAVHPRLVAQQHLQRRLNCNRVAKRQRWSQGGPGSGSRSQGLIQGRPRGGS